MKIIYKVALFLTFFGLSLGLRAQITGDTSLCAGDVVTYYAPVVSGASYSWSVTGGSILVRQCGTRIFPGPNVGMGRDYTLFAKIPGTVSYERFGKGRTRARIIPALASLPSPSEAGEPN